MPTTEAVRDDVAEAEAEDDLAKVVAEEEDDASDDDEKYPPLSSARWPITDQQGIEHQSHDDQERGNQEWLLRRGGRSGQKVGNSVGSCGGK